MSQGAIRKASIERPTYVLRIREDHSRPATPI
jgi:hypothetical protein